MLMTGAMRATAAFAILLTHTLYVAALPPILLSRGLGGATVGVVLCGFAIGAFLARLALMATPISRLHLRVVIGLGIAALCLSQLAMLVIPLGSATAALRIANGTANAMLFFALFSTLSSCPERSAKEIGALGGGAAAALVLGSPGGLWLTSLYGERALFVAGLTAAAIASVATWRAIGQPRPANLKTTGKSRDMEIVRMPPILLSLGLIGCSLGGLEAAVPLVSNDIGQRATGLSFVLFGVGFVAGRLLGGKVAFSRNIQWMVAAGLTLAAVAAVSSGLWLTGFVVAPSALGIGVVMGAAGTILMVRLRAAGSENALGARLLAGQLANDIGLGSGIFFASTLSSVSPLASFGSIAVACLSAAWLCLASWRPVRVSTN